jgi:predicted Rossmann-fold nucleotide-binding protein
LFQSSFRPAKRKRGTGAANGGSERLGVVETMAGPVVVTLAELRDAWPDLRDKSLMGLDLRGESFDWSAARLDRAMFLGCLLPERAADRLAAAGAGVFSALDDLPFAAYRADLYSYDELTTPAVDTGATLDARVASWFASSSTSVRDAVIRAVHDATVDAAVARFVAGRRVVGVMGGHALERGADLYRTIADTGRALTRSGFSVATGGGPGAMEAANLGAWMAPFTDGALDDALGVLAVAPDAENDAVRYRDAALAVRARWPRGGESLGVPTWVYVNEPTTAFATHLAKYFTNSIREAGLLAVARSGVVYAPGTAGTEEEIFTDTAQNSLTLYEVRSPMVFLGRRFFELEHPELVTAARRQATRYGWADLFTVCDEPEEVVAFIRAHDPDEAGRAGVERRRRRKSS